MAKIIEIKLGDFRGVGRYDLNNVDCDRDDCVIVETNRSAEFGRIISKVKNVCEQNPENIDGKILRKATRGDLSQIANNRMKAKEAVNLCMQKITERRLGMHIVKAEYSFDSSKIIFQFTAEGRVDFRHLVKDLARIFRVRIELKQIGVRDKAKIVKGYGVCGRELCCSSYMKNFHPLSVKMAKGQGLPLNPTRIAGVCGRIKCCMAYEFSTYKALARTVPGVGERIETSEGAGRVVDMNILKRLVKVDLGEGKIMMLQYFDDKDPQEVRLQTPFHEYDLVSYE